MKTIGIIGAGASGMVAAIAAATKNKNTRIVLIEQKDSLGKKILVTGNGKCNLTNEDLSTKWYRGDDLSIVENVLESYDTEKIRTFFQNIGLLTKSKGTYIYPRTEQAVTVRDVLENKLKDCNVKICLHTQVIQIKKEDRFRVEIFDLESKRKGHFFCDQLILACGGTASRVHGSDGSGYGFAKSLGHHTTAIVPALVQLKVKNNPYTQAAGVRTLAQVSAIIGNTCIRTDEGELQLTNYGVSGIPIFQISRDISKALRGKQKAQVMIDFLPDFTKEQLIGWMQYLTEKCSYFTVKEMLESIVPAKLGACILKEAQIAENLLVSQLTKEQKKATIKLLKESLLTIGDTKGFDQAQVCAGGVCTEEIDPFTMESKLVKGLYIVGELMDVDGLCGGYNLHWAFSTGMIAGISAASK